MKKSDRYIKLVYWSEEDQLYIGRSPGFFHGGVHGDDEARVYAELVEVIDDWIDIFEEEGDPLPPPTCGKTYSGKFNLRVGEDFHERLAFESLRFGESLNSFCIRALKKGVEELTQGG